MRREELEAIREQLRLAQAYPSRTDGNRLYLDAPVEFVQAVLRLLAEVERQQVEMQRMRDREMALLEVIAQVNAHQTRIMSDIQIGPDGVERPIIIKPGER